jgi:PTS system nitrogen regulatory IIA component
MDLKIKDVADLLNVSETKIHRWLSCGEIPAYRINEEYLFNRSEIESWVMNYKPGKGECSPLTEQFSSHVDENKDLSESDVNSGLAGGKKQFSLYRALHKGMVMRDMPGKTKEDVIRATMKFVAKDMNVDADVVSEMLLERENLQPTALNQGIGIPHTRDFLLSVHHDIVTLVFPKTPLEYGALDGHPVHSLFFLFAGDDKRHLNLLAKIAHLSSQPSALELLKSKPSKEQMLAFIKDWEGSILLSK